MFAFKLEWFLLKWGFVFSSRREQARNSDNTSRRRKRGTNSSVPNFKTFSFSVWLTQLKMFHSIFNPFSYLFVMVGGFTAALLLEGDKEKFCWGRTSARAKRAWNNLRKEKDRCWEDMSQREDEKLKNVRKDEGGDRSCHSSPSPSSTYTCGL